MIRAAFSRLWRGLTTWPDLGGWGFSALVGALTLAAMAAVGFSSGFYHLSEGDFTGWPLKLLIVFIAPGLGEELPFRGLLIPDRTENPRPWWTIFVVTICFTAWHVVEGETFMARAMMTFLRPDFLACAAILGLGCAIVRWRTGSVWPAVALHWGVVVVWLTWFGGAGLEGLQ